MKKSCLVYLLNKSIEEKALKDLNAVKTKHSKVLHLKHDYTKMKKYFMPNKMKTTREDIQLIFKLRKIMKQCMMIWNVVLVGRRRRANSTYWNVQYK